MTSRIRLDRYFPVLPVTCGVYNGGYSYEFEIPPFDYYADVFKYAQEHTDNVVVLAYPKREEEDSSPDCEVYNVGTAIQMCFCEPVVRKGELWSYAIETEDTLKVRLQEFTKSSKGVRLVRCCAYKERSVRLSFEQTMNLLLPIWISIRANVGVADSLTSVLPTTGSKSFLEYMDNLDKCLDQVCMNLPLEYKHRAAFFAADHLIKRAGLVLRFLNQAHSSGFKIDVLHADSDVLSQWNKYAKVSRN